MHKIRIARDLSPDRAMGLLREHGSLEVQLADMARAWNPASTKRAIFGPARITYVLHPDGGVDASVQ